MGGKKVFELNIEIGHKSTPLSQKLANGYTHKWMVFVRGADNSRIEHCIQRVVFQLHESFENPHREIFEPPFQIKETGYAGFEIPIEIYFKNRDKPNHLVFVHDLCLLTKRPNDKFITEKIKFINPNKEFEKYLYKSGAHLLTNSVKKETNIKSPTPPPPSALPPVKKEKRDSPTINVKKERHDSPPPVKKYKTSSALIPSKDMSKQSKEFMDVFGPPLVYQKASSLDLIKKKISTLDCAILQKIVDIIEEAGENYRITSKKFEFDLKSLNPKTLNKIEKCLQR